MSNYSHDSKLLSENHFNKKEYYETELLKTLSRMMELNKVLTSSRNDLCMRPDFNIVAFFRHFDKKAKGVIGLAEAELGFG